MRRRTQTPIATLGRIELPTAEQPTVSAKTQVEEAKAAQQKESTKILPEPVVRRLQPRPTAAAPTTAQVEAYQRKFDQQQQQEKEEAAIVQAADTKELKEIADEEKQDLILLLEADEPPQEVQQEAKLEEDLYEEAKEEGQLKPQETAQVESWLSIVNPTAAQSRALLEAAIEKAKKKLKIYQNVSQRTGKPSAKIPVVEEEITSLQAQLDSVKESESDLLLRLKQFTNLGTQALEFVTDFMRNFFLSLRKKMDHVINFFYTVFVEMIPKMVASISSAITDPIKKLLSAAWSSIKWAGEKVKAFGDGIVSAAKYLRELGGDLSSQTWTKLKEFYAAAKAQAGERVKGLLFGSAKLAWITSKTGASVALFSVNGVWKIVTSPTTMLVLSAVVKYINAIWNDPLWGKFVMEIFSYARNIVCEKVSNYFYDPRFQEVNALDKTLEHINAIGSKVMDVAQFGIWKGTTDFLCEGGLKNTMQKAGEGFVQGLKENISAKSILGSVPLLGGFGSILGGAIDSALGSVAEQSITAAAEAAEQAAILSKKKALLLEQWDFWIKFFTDDCVFPRVYNYNSEGWTQSTITLLTMGWGASFDKDSSRPPLTQAHIDLEKQLVEQRAALKVMQTKQNLLQSYIADFTNRATNKLELPSQYAGLKDNKPQLNNVLLQLTGAIQTQNSVIAKGEQQTREMMAEAIERRNEENAGKKQGKGLWNALGLPNSVKEAAEQVGLGEVQQSISNFIFTEAALETKQSAEVEKYLAASKKLLKDIEANVTKKNGEIDALQKDLEGKMKALRAVQDGRAGGSWNPFDWIAGSKDDSLSAEEKKAAEEIQTINEKLTRLREDVQRNEKSYLSVLTKLDNLGDKPIITPEAAAELKQQQSSLAPPPPTPSPPPAPSQ